MSHEPGRYARQERLAPIGIDGQGRLRAAHVLVVGCGALGTMAAELLARAGVGTLTLVDRDVVEWSNLQRQMLFDEEDARRATPKVEAAKSRIAHINGEVRVRAFFDDFNASTAERYAEGADVVVDGLDNLETRYLLNDVAVLRELPYVYGAAIGTEGMTTVVLPNVTPCLRCLFPDLPPPGTLATCESAGVLGTVTALVASLEVTEAIKILVGNRDAVMRELVSINPWTNATRHLDTRRSRDPDCPCCGQKRFEFLDGTRVSRVTVLCGKNAVQFAPAVGELPPDLDSVERRLALHEDLRRDSHAVSCTLREVRSPDGGSLSLSVFADGRILVRGTREPEFAKSMVARFVGH